MPAKHWTRTDSNYRVQSHWYAVRQDALTSPDGVLRREITEDIEIELIPLIDLRARVLRGEIDDGSSALAIFVGE